MENENENLRKLKALRTEQMALIKLKNELSEQLEITNIAYDDTLVMLKQIAIKIQDVREQL